MARKGGDFVDRISIHALLTESDIPGLCRIRPAIISIHALLTESDRLSPPNTIRNGYFNPRSPHGERRFAGRYSNVGSLFQSTLSSRRATRIVRRDGTRGVISIHALLTESDLLHQLHVDLLGNFNPRSPHGERRVSSVSIIRSPDISIHALLTESDNVDSGRSAGHGISIHALLTESDNSDSTPASTAVISIHALLTESDSSWTNRRWLPRNFNPRSPHGERQQIPPNWPYRFCLKCQF